MSLTRYRAKQDKHNFRPTLRGVVAVKIAVDNQWLAIDLM